MPTYGYRCPKCSLEFDVWQRMSDDPVAACPNCATTSRRLFFPAGIVFKGTGFYKNDSRKQGADGSSSAASKSTPAAKDKEKTDTKATPASTSSGQD